MDFKKQYDDDGQPIACDCCNYPGWLSTFKSKDLNTDKRVILCEVCATTFLSNALYYPSEKIDTELYKSISILGNILLEEIRDQGIWSKRTIVTE